MQRYKFIEVIRDKKTNNRVLSSTLFPKIDEQEDDIFVNTNIGDRLDLLAHHFYDDVTLWWVIAQANKGILKKGSMNVSPGLRLRIPQNINKIFNDLRRLNEAG